MTEPDLEAMELRWQAADLATVDSRKTPHPETGIMGVGTTSITAIWDSASDVPDLLQLVKTVKLGWQQEKDRADRLEFELQARDDRIKLLESVIKGYQGQG